MKASVISDWHMRLVSATPNISRGTVLLGLLLTGCVLTGCTVADTGPSTSSNAEAPLPTVNLPSLRLPGQSTAIDSLSADQAEKKVSISGNVTERVATLDGWLYRLQDSTGSLWVVTNQSDPVVGEMATVSGVVKYEAIVVDEIDAGEIYLQEQSYRPNN
jgi:hypothetical protein